MTAIRVYETYNKLTGCHCVTLSSLPSDSREVLPRHIETPECASVADVYAVDIPESYNESPVNS